MTYSNKPMAVYGRKRYQRVRQQCIDFLGGKCAVCGTAESLEFDHIDRNQKTYDIGSKISGRSYEQLKAELTKCQLLCWQHHKDKSVAEKSVTHGGGLSGKKNCKCILCKTRKNEYMRAWKQKHRP